MNRSHLQPQVLAVLLATLSPAPALAVEVGGGHTVEADAAGGAQFVDLTGDREKFEEYRDVPDGFVLDRLQFRLRDAQEAVYLDFAARNVLRDDASYRLEAGRLGKVRVGLQYDLTPHHFSRGVLPFGGLGTGHLRVADVVQEQLQANEQAQADRGPPATDPNLDVTGGDALQQGIVRGLFDGAQDVLFGLRRERTGAYFEYSPFQDVEVRVRVTNENRDGLRVIGAGSYERWNVGSGVAHTADRFFTVGNDLAEPLDYQTVTVAAGAGVHKSWWLADLEYTFTDFANPVDALLWDNPFRLSDAQAGGPGNNFGRGRFAVGQLVLPPGSSAHDITATAAADLPWWRGRLTGSLGFGFALQDQPFQPYTRNTAILANNVEGTPSAASLALPRESLDGEVQTRSGTLTLALRPLDLLGVDVRYRYHKYDGRSQAITFPGYAAFGESYWRAVKNDKNAPVVNEIFDFTRQSADLVVDLRLVRPLTLFVEGGWEGTDFSGLRLRGMDEFGVGGRVLYRPGRSTTVKAGYHYLDRTTDPYLKGRTLENPEATGLFNFNWAERRRHQADVRVQMAPASLVSFGVLARGVDEEYGGRPEEETPVDAFRFGRTRVRSLMAGGDVTLSPTEHLDLFVSYTWEYRQERMASASKDDAPKGEAGSLGIADDYAPENYWNSDIYERVHTVGAGATAQLIPDRLAVDASYSFSYSNLDVETRNPNGVTDLTLANAVAQDWPTLRNRLHQVSVDLHYGFTANIRMGVRYLFDWYKLDDFAWDPLQPYMAGLTPENTTRFIFADASYKGYTAHVGTLYLAGRF